MYGIFLQPFTQIYIHDQVNDSYDKLIAFICIFLLRHYVDDRSCANWSTANLTDFSSVLEPCTPLGKLDVVITLTNNEVVIMQFTIHVSTDGRRNEVIGCRILGNCKQSWITQVDEHVSTDRFLGTSSQC